MLDNTSWTLIASIAGAIAGFAGATIGAKLNADKDIRLQRERLSDERTKIEVALERENMCAIHRALSKIAFENSLTMSVIQSDSELTIAEFRVRYVENCDRLHAAMATSAVYYPAMTSRLRAIFGEANKFWGYQEIVLRADYETDRHAAQAARNKVFEACEEIDRLVSAVQGEIEQRSQYLTNRLRLQYLS